LNSGKKEQESVEGTSQSGSLQYRRHYPRSRGPRQIFLSANDRRCRLRSCEGNRPRGCRTARESRPTATGSLDPALGAVRKPAARRTRSTFGPKLVRIEVFLVKLHRVLKEVVAVVFDLVAAVVIGQDKDRQPAGGVEAKLSPAAARQEGLRA